MTEPEQQHTKKLHFSFPKSERLRNQSIIEELFKKGSSSFLYPFKVIYPKDTVLEEGFPQILITVPKKSFKKAVHRNKIRRRIREAYRLNKHQIFSKKDSVKPSFIGIIYVGKEILPFDLIQRKLILIFERLKI